MGVFKNTPFFLNEKLIFKFHNYVFYMYKVVFSLIQSV